MISISQARREAAARLSAAGIETAALDARLLLGHVLDLSTTQLMMREQEEMRAADQQAYFLLIDQRVTGVPVAYLIGEREFMGLTFRTSPAVLVPRPDTEPLVEWGLDWMRAHPTATIADIGTGSGAIAVSIAYHAPQPTSVIATDVSEEALAIAGGNASALLDPERLGLFQPRLGNLTEPLEKPVDLMLTNLPYLTPEQIAGNPDLSHEPRLALDGGEDGLDLVRRVIADLPRALAPEGAVGFEIDPAQAGAVMDALKQSLPHHQVRVIRDLAGDDRHVVASRS